MSAIKPSCAFDPTAVQTTVALPYVIRDPEKTILSWSPSATFPSGLSGVFAFKVPDCFSTLSDSPVRALSLTFSE